MKSIGSLSRWIACGVVAVSNLLATSTEAAVGRAVVRAVRGTAEYSVQGGEWKTLAVGKVLGPTSSVKTGVNSGVDLFLGENGPTVRLLADTTLGLDTLNIDRTGVDVVIETFLDLKTGTIQGNVKTLAAASKYEVKTPFTVCAIKGTEYQISADGTVHVIKGSVVVAYRVGQPTVTVNAGQTFVPPAQPTAQPTVRPTQPTEVPPSIPDVFDVVTPPAAPTAPPPVEFVSPGTGRPAGGG
ncbi:MAG: FecR domain-containing protein [Verrucomicrobia bacterium]|nr:FecR domain-containing protein [Verrucomicrobiota bacterium]